MESTMPPALEAIASELGNADRQERIEMLIDFAKSLPPLPEKLAEFKDTAHRVQECQSPIYLFVEVTPDQTVELHADAPIEAPTVRGFVAILVEGLAGATAQQVLALQDDLIERSGLPEILGMLRVRGLHGVLRRIKTEVARGLIANELSSPTANTTRIS